MAKRGRRPGATGTRDEILTVARMQFADLGYDRTTIRSVAEAAGVHPALLHHYFGTKRDLYSEAISFPGDPWAVIAALVDDTPRDQLPEALVRHYISTWRDPVVGVALRAQVRDVFTDPVAAGLHRTHLQTMAVPRLAAALEVPETNVAVALNQLIGLVLGDSFFGIEQLATTSEDDLVALVAPAIATYLTPTSEPGRRPPTQRRPSPRRRR